jgi:putative peptidoglycan lipid II flippase
MDVKAQVTRAAGIYTLGILVSRLLGVVREIAIAYFLGTGMVADAFFVAFRLPNLWRCLFAEGSLVIVFVPIFSEHLLQSRSAAIKLGRIVWTFLSINLILLSLFGIIFAPWLVKLIAPGFSSLPAKFGLAVNLTRIMFPYIFFICLTALAIAILNALGYFAAPAFCYALLNISMIASLFFAHQFGLPAVHCLAIGVMVGGILQLALQLPFLYKEGFSLKPLWENNPILKRIFNLMGPAVLGAAVYQLSIFINTILASFLPSGSVSYLYYADRLVQFPLALFAFSLGTASLPALSAQAAKKDVESFKQTLCFGLQTVFFLTFPAAIGLMVLRVPIIRVFFERGAFSEVSTYATAQALWCYALGLIFFGALRLLNNAFYALQDTKTPVKISAFCLLINIFLGLILMHPFKHAGLALTTSVVGCLNVFCLIYFFKKRFGPLFSVLFWQSVIRTTLASLGMGLMLLGIKGYFLNLIKLIVVSIPVGMITFFLFAYMLKSPELIFLKGFVKKKLFSSK